MGTAPILHFLCTKEKTLPMSNAPKKKYLLIAEDTIGQRGSMPIILEVTKETEGMYMTPEVFSVNLRDLAPSYMRKKKVRWDRFTGKRVGDREAHTQFRVKQVLTHIEPELARTAMLVVAQ